MALYDVQPNLVRLAVLGFLNYDAEADKVHVLDKLFDYVNDRSAKRDYDVIQFPSVVRGSANATVNLLNYDMTIFGVKQIYMSDSQNVVIYPNEQKIILKLLELLIF